MNNILVVNVNWLGDVIFSAPVFKALKEAYPTAKVSCLAVPRVREVLESIPYVDEVIAYDEKGAHWGPLGKLKLILGLRRRRFDISFLLHRSLTRALLVYCAGIPQRVGYNEKIVQGNNWGRLSFLKRIWWNTSRYNFLRSEKGRGRYLTHKVTPLQGEVHRSDHYLNVVESYGVAVRDRRCELTVSARAEQEVASMLMSQDIRPEDFLVAVNPGGNWDLKRWPRENFSALIERLMDDPKVKVVVLGVDKDTGLVNDILAPLKRKPAVLTGKTNLKQLLALMKRADILVSADSGPLHLAGSVGTDVVAVFGPTRPAVTGPRGIGRAHILQMDVGCNREACYFLGCPDNICMQSITVEDVFERIRQIQDQ